MVYLTQHFYIPNLTLGFPDGSVMKNPPAMQDTGLIPGSGRSREKGIAVFGESHGQSSLAGA